MADAPPTLVDRLHLHGCSLGDAPALSDPAHSVTWAQLDAQTNRIANALAGAGIGAGARVALMVGADVAGVLWLLGVLKAGASVVPVPGLVGDEAVLRILSDCQAGALLVSERYRRLVTPRVANMPIPRIAIDFEAEGYLSAGAFLDGADETAPEAAVRPRDEFNIIYSSGTTGRPKGIVHSHALRAAWSIGVSELAFPAGVRTLTTTSLYSNWTLCALVYTLWNGGHAHLMERFSPGALVEACQGFAPDNVYLVPVQVARLLDDPTAVAQLAALPPSTKWCAGSRMPVEHKREILRLWPGGLIEVYGMTEGAPSTLLLAHERPDKLHTVGSSDVPDGIKIIDEDGLELGVGRVGEVVGRAVDVTDGYHNDPEATAALIWRDAAGDPFLRSGDIGCLDEEGFLQILDRKKDMIISGGFNVYAADLEEVLAGHPEVAEAAVFAIPSAQWGETPAAAVTLRDSAGVQGHDLRDWANQRLGRVQRLAAVVVVERLPRGALGKVLKRELRERFHTLNPEHASFDE
ncbi:class I adenylate-forming enzyme family protein [Phenylobacterium sp.]|uniref:class I adenylate-forming enzyme family protein n=1 Tax=Phenylobacterium sp. TaxID=1871053 RepID=UPI0028A1EF13|nr:class I adenylate-forming enzyme family protein [Phenylobacterium sp.]